MEPIGMEPVDPAAPAARRAVPRPPGHRPGGPPPWEAVPADRRRGISLDRVRPVLAGSQPGHGATGRQPHGAPAAAVLVPLFEEDGETRVVLTVRSDQLRSHQGEVAFPGGRLDGEEGVVQGALREAREEVGIDPRSVTVIGELASVPTVSSTTTMTPVVGVLDGRPRTTANPGEVERVFDVALRDLVADGVFHEEWWTVPGPDGTPGRSAGGYPVWFFAVAGETVWGATARCLTQLLCLVLGVPVPPSFGPRLPAG